MAQVKSTEGAGVAPASPCSEFHGWGGGGEAGSTGMSREASSAASFFVLRLKDAPGTPFGLGGWREN